MGQRLLSLLSLLLPGTSAAEKPSAVFILVDVRRPPPALPRAVA
jgi:hypothetical protein